MTCCPLITLTLKIISVRCIPLNLRSKTRRRATLLLPTWIYSCQSVGTVNFTLPFTTSVTILISILQTFRSWAATSHLRPAYGVFISQLIRYARASSSYECFILRAVRLSNKLLGQGYVKERLRSSLRKFYGRYGDLIKQYEVPLSQMLHDILDDDHLQWHPLLIRHYTNFWSYYWSWPYNRIWLFTLLREVSIEHLQRVWHANRGRLLLRTPGPVPLWDLQVF